MVAFSVLLAGLFFAILLISSVRVFGALFGSPMRGAVLPLVAIPLATDWCRFLLKLSPAAALAGSVALYLVFTAVFFLRAKPKSPFSGMDHAARRNWWFCLAILLVAHILIRTWIFTGSVPNPADDNWAGYKSDALIHSSSWPTMLPSEPEISMSYYYYGWMWSAGLASWFGAAAAPAWWVSAIVFCVTGGMLIIELFLPHLRDRRSLALASLVIIAGCSISALLAIPQGLKPQDWGWAGKVLCEHYGLYMIVAGGPNLWTPTAVFAQGVLMVALVLLWRLFEDWTPNRPASIFVVLALASLAGYCTFDLFGFGIVVLPVLVLAVLVTDLRGALRRWFPHLIAMGIASVLLCLPLLLSLLHRAPGAHLAAYIPLLVWLQTAPQRFGLPLILGLAVWAVLSTALGNVLIFPVLFREDRQPLPAFTRLLIAIFFFGAFVCFFGVSFDFPSKFGQFVALTAILAFFTLEKPPKWAGALLLCGVVGPGLITLNTVRANIFLQKVDPVWRTLDQLAAQTHEVVLYDITASEHAQRGGWLHLEPFFSRIQFLEPADQVVDADLVYFSDPALLKSLPPTMVRLHKLMNGAHTYLLLRTGTAAPKGTRLYSSPSFSLDRVSVNDPVAD